MRSRELQFADKISSFLLEQSKDMGFGECFIGSTEVLESLFGKIKYMEHEQTAFGFTSLVLAAIATVGLTDDQTIAKAIKSINSLGYRRMDCKGNWQNCSITTKKNKSKY